MNIGLNKLIDRKKGDVMTENQVQPINKTKLVFMIALPTLFILVVIGMIVANTKSEEQQRLEQGVQQIKNKKYYDATLTLSHFASKEQDSTISDGESLYRYAEAMDAMQRNAPGTTLFYLKRVKPVQGVLTDQEISQIQQEANDKLNSNEAKQKVIQDFMKNNTPSPSPSNQTNGDPTLDYLLKKNPDDVKKAANAIDQGDPEKAKQILNGSNP
jgi:hypothetical protein